MHETEDVTKRKGRGQSWRVLWLGPVLILTASAALQASAATGQFVVNNTPGFVATAQSLGPEDPSETIEVTIWLQLHNRADLDSMAAALYDPTSPQYQNW